jgi:prepilin-type N-terminal cleavage/methylation domain-containing protein
MIQRFQKNQKGFTLIELMIVIAIIGILAAIAVPQFMAYRIRSYNAAAKAVVHNIKADQGNLNSELGAYGHTEATAADLRAPVAAVGTSDTHTNSTLRLAATGTQAGSRLSGSFTNAAGELRSLAIPTALGNEMIARAVDSVGLPSTFVVTARHYKGDTGYGIDADVENAMYTVSNPTWTSQDSLLEPATTTPATADANEDDFTALGGGGAPTANWTLSD